MRGALLMLGAIGLFALTDVATKWLSAGYGGGQVIALRCADRKSTRLNSSH